MVAIYLLVALLSVPAVLSYPAQSKDGLPPECKDPTFACQDLESARSCDVVKTCIHDIWSTMSAPDDNDEICDLCKEMVKEARDQLLSNMTQEEIKEVFEGSCKLLPVTLVANACIKIVDELIPELVEMLASRMDPTMVCTVSGLCNLAHLPIQKSKPKDELTCEFCTHVLEHVKELVTANTTVDEFRTALLNFCNHTGSFSSKCTLMVDDYFDILFKYIRNMDTKEICTLIGICTGKTYSMHITPSVNVIPAVVQRKKLPMRKLIPANKISESMDLHPFVNIVPPRTPSKKPQDIHKTIESNEIFGSSASRQLPAERFTHPATIFQNDVDCAFCNAISFYLEADLEQDISSEAIENAVNGMCEKWVKEYPDFCKTFFDKYSESIKQVIRAKSSVNDICKPVNACPAEKVKLQDLNIKIVPKDSSSTLCDLCKEAFDVIENQLKDPSVKKRIEDLAGQVCSYLPESVRDDCQNFVDQNVDNLLNILEQELTGDNVCPALHLCPGYIQKAVSQPIKDIECDLCETLVNQLKQQLEDPSMKTYVKNLLENGCSILPQEVADECKTLVDENIDSIINILVQEMDADFICSTLHLCNSSLSHKMTLKKANDVDCDLCKMVVQKVDDELKDQKTEEAIKEALDKVCSYLPSSLSKDCNMFVDKYSEMIITILAEQMDPGMVCSALKLCSGKGFECEGCHYVFHFIQEQMMDAKIQENLKSSLKKACNLLPTVYANNCVAFIDEYGSSLLVIVAQELDPGNICQQLRACNATKKNPAPKPIKESVKPLKLDECALCTSVVDSLDKLLEEDDIDKEITAVVEKVCSYLPSSLHKRCSVLVETYGPYILQMIGQAADSKTVCQDIDMCARDKGMVHLLGGKKCTFGPTYWCQSKVHASACKAEMYCKQKVWIN